MSQTTTYEECPKCHGQGRLILGETNDQYDHTWIQWDDCPRCQGAGEVEIEPEDDE